MFIDRIINPVLAFLFGKQPDGDRKVWMHSINRNEDKKGRPRFPPYHGSFFFHFGYKLEASFEYHCWRFSPGIGFSFDPSEHGWMFHLCLPPFSFYWSTNFFTKLAKRFFDGPRMADWNEKHGGYKGSNRYTAFRFFDVYYSFEGGSFRWEFLKFDWGWSNKMPKWMDGHIDVARIVFGKHVYEAKDLETRDIVIPMPEGNYPAKATLKIETRGRTRWFKKVDHVISVDVVTRGGIPHEGKGENSWDCGKDGLCGYGYSGESFREAADYGTQLVLEKRKKYDGNRMAKYPDPSTLPTEPVPAENAKPSSTLN